MSRTTTPSEYRMRYSRLGRPVHARSLLELKLLVEAAKKHSS